MASLSMAYLDPSVTTDFMTTVFLYCLFFTIFGGVVALIIVLCVRSNRRNQAQNNVVSAVPNELNYADYMNKPNNIRLGSHSVSGHGGDGERVHIGVQVVYIPELSQIVKSSYCVSETKNESDWEHIDVPRANYTKEQLIEILKRENEMWLY